MGKEDGACLIAGLCRGCRRCQHQPLSANRLHCVGLFLGLTLFTHWSGYFPRLQVGQDTAASTGRAL